MKDQIPVMDLPLLGKTKKLPFPATLFTAVIVAVRMFPAFVFFLCIPDYLRVRADQEVIAPPLQLLAAGTVYYFIFFSTICNPHDHVSFL